MRHVIFVTKDSGLLAHGDGTPPTPSIERFVERTAHIEIMGGKKLSNLVWLVDFHNHPDVLATLIRAAEDTKWSYAILPLVDAKEWVDPKGMFPTE